MEKSKREKAIIQAQASLSIDRIYLKPEFVASYRIQHGLSLQNNAPKLMLKRSSKNVKH